MVEKLNRTVTETLAKLVNDEDTSVWETMIPLAQLAYNAAPHSSLTDTMGTVVSPAEVHTGTHVCITLDSRLETDETTSDHTRTTGDALAAAEWIEQQGAKYHSSMHRGAAQRRLRLPSFEIGDLVAF